VARLPRLAKWLAFWGLSIAVACVGQDPDPATPSTLPADASSPAADANASPPSDAGADAAIDECPPGQPHDFCETFDHVTRPDERWTQKQTTLSARIELATGEAPPSLPNAVRFSVERLDAGQSLLTLGRTVPWPRTATGAQTAARVEAKLFIEKSDPERANQIMFLTVGTPAAGLYDVVFAQIDGGGGVVLVEVTTPADGGPFTSRSALVPNTIAKREWTTLALDITERSATSAGTATLSVNGVKAKLDLSTTTTSENLQVQLGSIVPHPNGGDWAIRYDDVRIDWLAK
jgi:hypothetical protein